MRAWRNQRLHTGDGLRRDADGNFYFVDRIKDAIRRRGENISSFEVEAQVNGHPDVLESTAVAVPSEFGEDRSRSSWCRSPALGSIPRSAWTRMARFMVPRYVEIVDQLPKTPTQKVRKFELRSSGVGPSTWDGRTPR